MKHYLLLDGQNATPMSSNLFRKDALNAKRTRYYGEIVLARPISFSLVTLIAAVMGMAVMTTILFGNYTRRSTVSGHLVPDIGVLRVFSPQPGIVLRKNVAEGQKFKRGDVLFVISSERRSDSEIGIQEEISRHIAMRQQSLRDELDEVRSLHQIETIALRKRMAGVENEKNNVSHQMQGQEARLQLAEAALRRAEQLSSQGYFSAEMTQQKAADLLDQRSRIASLMRDQINLETELSALQSELQSLPARHKSQISNILRQITTTGQELAESEGKRAISVTAPQNGVATEVSAEVGETVGGEIPLLSIIPRGANLQADLYAPSRAIGFIKPGDKVLLRYQAYPYQKFGQAQGIVFSISRISISPNEVVRTGVVGGGGEPLYRISVRLHNQFMTAYGNPQSLQAGMLVEADILQETRKIYEWMLEPLFSLTSRL